MRSKILFVSLIFDVCLVLFVYVAEGKICGGNEFTITDSNGTFIRCLRCATCHPGFGLEPKCGMILQHPPNVSCPPCKAGTFSSHYDSSSCKACHQCAKGESIKEFCSNKSDTICSGKCEKGFYLRKKAPHNCQKCSSCCLDGKDEKIQECIDQGLNEQCSPRPDKSCSPSYPGGTDASKSGGLSTTSISIIAVVGAVVLIAAVIATVYTCYRRRKRHRQQNVEAQPSRKSDEMSYASQGPSTLNSGTRVKCILPASNPSYQVTPCASQADLLADNPGPHAMMLHPKQPKSNLLQQSTAVSAKPSKLPEEKQRKPSLHREGSQDSQTSENGEARFRKRSNSASISIHGTLIRTFSGKDEALLEEDQDEKHEPIKIDRHPKSQTAKEGSKVEFRCKVQGKSTKLLYQWFKDGEPMLKQNLQPSLVFDSVELRDFGHYMCLVSYQDSSGEGVESSSAKLDVTPQCRNGKSPKLLADVDISTRDKIASLLENKRYSLGGCREVAAKYGMEDHKIGVLNNSKEPGKDVIEFLMGSKPNLTVYDFCKFLKEDEMRRLDVVKILEDHFLVREGSEYV